MGKSGGGVQTNGCELKGDGMLFPERRVKTCATLRAGLCLSVFCVGVVTVTELCGNKKKTSAIW